MTRRRRILRALVSMAIAALVVVPAASIAAPNGPTAGQRVDMRVLLVSPSATDGVALAGGTR